MADAKAGLEAFAKPNEKRLLASIFGGAGSDSDSEGEEQQQDEEVPTEVITTFRSAVRPEYEISVVERRSKGIAHQLWPAAEYLSDYLALHPELLTNGGSGGEQLVLELGAGLGLTGLFVSRMLQGSGSTSSEVLLTDLPEALPGLLGNISRNRDLGLLPATSAEVLEWGNEAQCAALGPRLRLGGHEGGAGGQHRGRGLLVIAADVVYHEHLFAPLALTLRYLCEHYAATAVLAHIKRWKRDQRFLALCRRSGLTVTTAEEQVTHPVCPVTQRVEKQVRRIYIITSSSSP